jgi:predicted signal transduction protein with EAL and GGDEF domain
MSNPQDHEASVVPAEKNFFQALFDLKFTEWVTLRVAGVLYLITVILLSLGALISFIALFIDPTPLAIFLGLILIPAGWFLLVLSSRLIFEAAIATIAVAQNTASLRK